MTSTLVLMSLAWFGMTLSGGNSAIAAEAADTPSASAAGTGGTLEEIVVTAQKRQQSTNTVPMSITALPGGG